VGGGNIVGTGNLPRLFFKIRTHYKSNRKSSSISSKPFFYNEKMTRLVGYAQSRKEKCTNERAPERV